MLCEDRRFARTPWEYPAAPVDVSTRMFGTRMRLGGPIDALIQPVLKAGGSHRAVTEDP